jgi:diaminohydroxyphosphoribosylaminopyrimidine deaminase/5-amino-6-(5-phosphoribosylamino)uracil reductase
MTVRLDDQANVHQPARIVLDSRFRLPPSAKILALPGRTLVFGLETAAQAAEPLRDLGAEIHFLPPGPDDRIDLHATIALLGELQFNEIMVETGAILNGALLREGLVDEWIAYLAPSILGDKGRGLFHLPELELMADRFEMRLVDTRQIGSDLRLKLSRI